MWRLIVRSTARASSTITKQPIPRNFHRVAPSQKLLTSVSLSSAQHSSHENGIAYYTTGADNGQEAKKRPLKKVQRLSGNIVSLQYGDFSSIRKELTQPGAITIDNGFAVMKSCSQLIDRTVNERALLVHTVWQELSKLIVKPSKSHVISLIDAFRRSGKELGNYTVFVERFGIQLDEDIYERLIYWSCQNDANLQNAEELIAEMEQKGYQPKEDIFNALIVGNTRYGLNAVEDVLTKMEKAHIKPSNETYTRLIIAYLRNNETTKALETFNAQFQRFVDYTTDQLYAIIRAAVAQRYEPLISAAINLLPETIKNAKSLAEDIQNICTEMVHLNTTRELETRMDPYELIIRHFAAPTHQIGDTDEYGSFLISEMVAVNETPANIFKLCHQLRDSERNSRALYIGCVKALAHKQPIAVDIMREINRSEPLRPHYFWPLFKQARGFDEVLKVLEFAAETKTMLDMRTFYEYVLPRMTSMDHQEMVAILTKHGAQMNELKSALIASLLNQKRPEEAKVIARQSKAYVNQMFVLRPLIDYVAHRKFKANEYTIVELVHHLQRSNKMKDNYDLAGQLLYTLAGRQHQITTVTTLVNSYQKKGVAISRNMADLIATRVSKVRSAYDQLNPTLISLIDDEMFPEAHEKQKTVRIATRLEQIEQNLAELQSLNQPTQGALFKLFGLYVQKRDMTNAKKMYEKCCEENVVPTAPFLSTCVLYWTLEKDAANALQAFDRLRRSYKDFKIDEYKIIDLMTLLIDTDRLSDAYNVLNQSRDGNPKEMTYISTNVWWLLTAASNYAHRHDKDDNLSKEMLDTLVKKGFCLYTNRHSSIVIKEYIEKYDIDEAVQNFKIYVKNNKTAPYMMTLLITLIRLANSDVTDNLTKFNVNKEQALEYIQQIVDIALKERTVGWVNANILMAFACAGREEQVRKILLDPTVGMDDAQLKSTVDYMIKRGNIDGVLILMRGSRGTPHTALDQESVCDSLLKQFEVDNDVESALKLYEGLANDEQSTISSAFQRRMRAILKRNNRNLPQGLLAI